MDIDHSINNWYKRISLIQRKTDLYKLHQDIFLLLSDTDGWDICIKSKGIVIGANTCILKCRCPRLYYEILKQFDVRNLPVHLLECLSNFIKTVYTEKEVTCAEKKLIGLIKAYFNRNNLLTSIDTYKRKNISCDINPLYYSLSHINDFSSNEFSDLEQSPCDDIESVIINQAIIDNHPKHNMNFDSSTSSKTFLNESQSIVVNKCPDALVVKSDNFLEDCVTDCIIDVSSLEDGVKLSANLKNKSEVNTLNNASIPLCGNSTACNTSENSPSCIIKNPKNKLNSSVESTVNKDIHLDVEKEKYINENYVSNLLNEQINITSTENTPSEKHSIDISPKLYDGNLDVSLLCNFEMHTVKQEEAEENKDAVIGNNEVLTLNNNKEDNAIIKEPLDFQTFTIIKHNDETLSNDLLEFEVSSDYKTFTVIDRNNPLLVPNKVENSQSSFNSKFVIDESPHKYNNDFDSNEKTFEALKHITSLSNNIKQVKIDEENITTNKNSLPDLDVKYFKSDISPKDSLRQSNSEVNNFNLSDTVQLKASRKISMTTDDLFFCSEQKCLNTHNVSLGNDVENNSIVHSTTLNFLDDSPKNNSNLNISKFFKEPSSPGSLNNDIFGKDHKPTVSNKLEFVPLGVESNKDSRSPRPSRKYMECSPVISANAFISDENLDKENVNKGERKNSSSFFIDFNSEKPKNKPKHFENVTKSVDTSTMVSNKEKMFSMFFDFNKDSESSELSSKNIIYRKPQTIADRFVRMHSEEPLPKTKGPDNTVTPPPSRMTSTVESSSVDITESCKKQSVFMFIENDSSAVVKRRSLPQSSRLKSQRNSWNVDSTITHKTHLRTHSVNLSEDGKLDFRMTKSHIETSTKENDNIPSEMFNSIKSNVKVTTNRINQRINHSVTQDSFVRLSDMDKAPSQEVINNLTRTEPKIDTLKKNLKNTELAKCLKRMFPYLKSVEIEKILQSKSPEALDSIEEVKSGLGQDLLKMFLEEIGADTTIDVNGRRIRAHKCVLTSRCQYFAAMFSGGWVQSAGNVLYLKGYSYKTVHLTLRYIYSGECNFSEIKNVSELSKLADMLCLEGLKDNIMLFLAAEYCHFFKEVCDRCTIGILECLTLSVAYGLDDLYLSCIVWINDNFSVVWPTKYFVALPQDLKAKCFKHKVAHIDDINDVLSITIGCEIIKRTVPNDEWAKELIDLTTDLSNSVIKYLAKNFYDTITSKYFKQILENENLFTDSFATHLLASCNCANRNQIRQVYDHLSKSLSNNFWYLFTRLQEIY
ncbi:uncharacterized protein LOC126907866 isoform X2 [Daktulosphaira vitifoliae]|uniref:uncharacterized protein LOC126907866 isoform X2 n=1 Tax=Daktulosphaira vitifoliae TaxID=58002 RepID=UPI0021AA739A|nr:uncharacterized protein LOC126907866 isoform X2 [Daktulosphaira vitifoliae]